jgi:hypothetical protein
LQSAVLWSPLAQTVTLDNVADDGNSRDGPAGARDNVKSDVENLIGGWAGGNSLTGSAANNRLTGGNQADSFYGLRGDDVIFANDNWRDNVIDCGQGNGDVAHIDGQDPTPVACETVGP